jgi:hypothetical protein
MPPIPTVRPNKPLERGQTTIFSTLNGAISLQRPAPTRPGPVTKSTGQANTVLERRLTGGPNEKQVIELLITV